MSEWFKEMLHAEDPAAFIARKLAVGKHDLHLTQPRFKRGVIGLERLDLVLELLDCSS